MTLTWIYALSAVFAVSLISLAGIFTLKFRRARLQKFISFTVSLSVGALFADAFIHLIPEAYEEVSDTTDAAIFVVLGILVFFILEKFLEWKHSHGELEETFETEAEHDHGRIKPVGILVLFSDGVHNIIDGVIIGASFLVSPSLGIASTIAILLHEIPHEIADYGILLHSGFKRKKALFFNFLSAATAILGTIVALSVGESLEGIIPYVLAFGAGNFIYIAGSDLVPELKKSTGVKATLNQIIAIVVGILFMIAITFFE
ncbi:MAG: ZIP family metal transporter [bacterium]|nr:ZIP family metal transporter [bacterium]